MKQANINRSIAGILLVLVAGACTVARPRDRSNLDAGIGADAGANEPPADGPPRCNANQPLRCGSDKLSLVRCNGDGTAELTESCPLGCVDADLRCAGLVPSNGLGSYLDMASGQPDLNLGDSAEINTDSGHVLVGGAPVTVFSDAVAQSGAPTIRVFVVRSLIAKNVDVIGSNALAIVSNGDVQISGEFAASAKGTVRGAGALGGGLGGGQPEVLGPSDSGLASGAGGGGFGGPGGNGGSAASSRGTVPGGRGGIVNGNESLVPLRGGCDGGGPGKGAGGGAIQLVSGSRIVVTGKVGASGGGGFRGANGRDGGGGAGGSGGGILLEAPVVHISGNLAANGGGGSGCGAPSDGRLDGTFAPGTPMCQASVLVTFHFGAGGNGGAGPFSATDGASLTMEAIVIAGYGGGGVGRIRINTATGGFSNTGVVSPNATTGAVARR